MKFKFYPTESRIYDLLKFPRLIFYRDGVAETDDNFKELIIDDYLDFAKRVGNKLEPYRKDIEIFYVKHFFNDFDFSDLITSVITIFNHKDEEEYLDMLLSLNEKEIIKAIVYSFIAINGDYPNYSDEIMNRAEVISSNKEELITFIKDLPIDSGAKWNLFLIVEEPVKYMRIYVDLLSNILPIFQEAYSPYELEIRQYGENLVEFLNKEGARGLEEITYSIIDPKVVDFDETNIFISLTFPYAISLNTISKNNHIAWGLKMEDVFKAMKEMNENKTNERVQIFKNLGDKTRYEVLKLIAAGETSTKEIANALSVSSATISYHINNLLTSKIIKMDKSDNRYGYIVDYQLLDEIIEDFKEDIKFPQS